MEINGSCIGSENPNGYEGDVGDYSQLVECAYLGSSERMTYLVGEEEDGHGEEEDVTRDIVSTAYPWHAFPCSQSIGEERAASEELGMALRGNVGSGDAVLGGNGNVFTVRQAKDTGAS